ncbi:MAG: NADH-quinone oxidoreductase subunit M [Candidatus Riflebacteria bacterium]|nr:NADH-quinone oxidoreductase subunit M [Candidatus Riflebacteria bacterium]
MTENASHALTALTFIPLLGALMILFVPNAEKKIIKTIAACSAFFPLVISVVMLVTFNRNLGGTGVADFAKSMQFVERYPWIEQYGIQYYLGVDGLSFPLVFLSALLSFICIIASWNIKHGIKGYFALFLLLETGIMGTFCALDFFLFFVFWELMLLPMYFLIGIWGGPRKEYAAIKFFLYTFLGSVLLLIAMLMIYFECGRTFSIPEMARQFPGKADWMRNLCFIFFFIAFAIKVPVFPFHTWLPDAHVEAPTAVSVILAGVLLKMGTYGMLRISYPLCPLEAIKSFSWVALLAWINIIYGAMCAMAQKDLKKLVAYSSISHMGIVLLGMVQFNDLGFNGAGLQMFNHGTITAMLFLLVGVIYDRAHHREIEGFGGLAAVTPIYAGIASFAFFAALGLPGMSSFISEAMVFLGGFNALSGSGPGGCVTDLAGRMLYNPGYIRWVTVFAIPGILVTAAYVLWTVQRVFLGQLNPKYKDLSEITQRELWCLVPLAVIILILGVFPAPLLNIQNQTFVLLLEMVKAAVIL